MPFPPGGFEGFFANTKVVDLCNLSAIKNIDPAKGDWPMLIMFYHPRCGASYNSAKAYKELGDYVDQHASQIKIAGVNATKSRDEMDALDFNIRGFPTFVLVKNSKDKE